MDKVKKGGNGPKFIDSVKSGEFLDNLKLSFDQLKGGNRQVLPDELKKKMEALDKQAGAFVSAQKKAEETAMELKRLTAALCSDAIAMYTPPAEKKAAPAAAQASTKKADAPVSAPVADEQASEVKEAEVSAAPEASSAEVEPAADASERSDGDTNKADS